MLTKKQIEAIEIGGRDDEWEMSGDLSMDDARELRRLALLGLERDEARAERDRRPDISAEDAAHAIQFFRGWDAPGSVTDRVFAALRAHAAKAVKP